MAERLITPVLIIGAGLSGCITALRLADQGINVIILASGQQNDNANSWLAQGGIIYQATSPTDAKDLAKDIFIAGHYHNNEEAVNFLTQQGPKAVEELLMQRLKVPFDKKNTEVTDCGDWDLTCEGGHSAHRIIHCADHTGRTIMQYLIKEVLANPLITIMQGYTAIDLLTSHHHTSDMKYRYRLENRCCGAYVLNEKTNEVLSILASHTILATGGVGQVYLHSTNSFSAIGSGIAMASRAGVRLENIEYVQFHPTSFFHHEPQRFLITEALRGEGGLLINAQGERFMKRYDKRGELAPRDIVAQSIVNELLATNESCVYLDARKVKHNLEKRFPTVFQASLERGIDMREQPIPVVPAAHYFCGGILTNNQGRTTLQNLYSVGECSCTGIHGANRLASTSLLEAVLWGRSTADTISVEYKNAPSMANMHDAIVDWCATGDEHNDDPALIAQDWAHIKTTMWNYVGITRTQTRLIRAYEDLKNLSSHIESFYKSTPISKNIIDLVHGCQAATLIAEAALRNPKKLGCHNRVN